jgi:hypothetical protein
MTYIAMTSASRPAATVEATREAIDAALRARGGAFAEYSCRQVSWDDAHRGNVSGALSVWGANITDTYLRAKDGSALYTVRPNNWNEKLGVVAADDVALLVGNCDPDGRETQLRNVTVREFLLQPANTGARYAGITDPGLSLFDPALDDKVSLRFQTVFLPVESAGDDTATRQTVQFSTEAYNYNTHSDDDPRNMILLATTQGLAVQADGRGAKKLLHHGHGPDRRICEYWLEAERSDHGVGGEQQETTEEREDALQRGKASSEVLGIKAMGKRFNTLMTIQIPLKQVKVPEPGRPGSIIPGLSLPVVYPLLNMAAASPALADNPDLIYKPASVFLCRAGVQDPKIENMSSGTSNAARVSKGEVYGHHEPLTIKHPVRNKDEHVTVTIVCYNVVAGGVPSKDDVIATVEDMEALYDACGESGRLADDAFDFMKSELTVADAVDVAVKTLCEGPGAAASHKVKEIDEQNATEPTSKASETRNE